VGACQSGTSGEKHCLWGFLLCFSSHKQGCVSSVASLDRRCWGIPGSPCVFVFLPWPPTRVKAKGWGKRPPCSSHLAFVSPSIHSFDNICSSPKVWLATCPPLPLRAPTGCSREQSERHIFFLCYSFLINLIRQFTLPLLPLVTQCSSLYSTSGNSRAPLSVDSKHPTSTASAAVSLPTSTTQKQTRPWMTTTRSTVSNPETPVAGNLSLPFIPKLQQRDYRTHPAHIRCAPPVYCPSEYVLGILNGRIEA